MFRRLLAFTFVVYSVLASRDILWMTRNTVHPKKTVCRGHHGNIETTWNCQGLTDVVDAPESQARVRFGSEEVRTMGQILTPTEVQMQPTVTWSYSPNKLYSVFMLDPDAPSRDRPIAAQWYHWGVVNVELNDAQNGDVVTEYFGPTPPMGTGLHRYVILVYEQDARIPVEGVNKIGMTAKDRGKRDIKRIASQFGLTNLIAGACFRAEWDSSVPFLSSKLK